VIQVPVGIQAEQSAGAVVLDEPIAGYGLALIYVSPFPQVG